MNLKDFELMVQQLQAIHGQYLTADDLVREFQKREKQAEKDLAQARGGFYGEYSTQPAGCPTSHIDAVYTPPPSGGLVDTRPLPGTDESWGWDDQGNYYNLGSYGGTDPTNN